MALYAIADPHLCLGADKPMDIFRGWSDYMQRFETAWRHLVTDDDTVIIPGDVSWATYLEEAKADLAFLHSLPGKKIIGRGNHDYWWETMNKLKGFIAAQGFDSISFLFNNAYSVDGITVCGTRGWFFDDTADNTEKLILREAGRLRLSLEAGKKLGGETVVFIHYPVVFEGRAIEPIFDVIKEYGVKRVYFGHIHGSFNPQWSHFTADGVTFSLISADYLSFTPKRIFPSGAE